MLLMTVTLLTIFYALDSFYYRREHDWLKKIGRFEREPLRIDGAGNFFYLGGIVAMVLMSGNWKPGSFDLFGVHMEIQNVLRDAMIIVLGTLSFLTTPGTSGTPTSSAGSRFSRWPNFLPASS